ncbi:FkbM family methyltransferase [Qipengyuania sp.]|uniref:FkbM family methyltransferase n=1 Tax=Qipengyuania sp. TaxID=2004515 RepID=UPI00373605B1
MPVSLQSIRRREGLKGWIKRRMFVFLRKQSLELYGYRGKRMAVYANDYIGHQINLFGIYEKEELEALARFLQPVAAELKTSTCLDIGANIGNHSVFFAGLFGRVHSFEPNPSNFRLLQFNAGYHDNIVPHDLALGEESGGFYMREYVDNFGRSEIVDDPAEGDVLIAVKTLDQFDLGEERVAFIKIDVEGMEPKVLRGAEQTIARHQPIIAMEQHRDDFRGGGSASVAWLTERGYRFCWYEGRPETSKLAKGLYDLREAFLGVEDRIVYGDEVPVRFHNMLIAVPPRYQQVLGLDRKAAPAG